MAKQPSAWNKFFARHRKNNKFTVKQIVKMWNAKKKGKKISNMFKVNRSKNNKSRVKSSSGSRKMARGNGSSYSKTNIALGTLLSQVAPKFVPQVAQFLPLTALLPKAPVALKVMGWGLASKIVSDRFINR